jgi:hypothetical protein
MTAWFQALFTPRQRCFSAFPHGTQFAIGLGTYLALEVDDPRIPAGIPTHGTRERTGPLVGYAYGALTLYGGPFQATSASLPAAPDPPATPHPPALASGSSV